MNDAKKIKLDHPDDDIWIHADSHIEIESRAFSCRKEPDTVKWINTYFQEGDTALDVGANIGAYSLIMSKVMNNIGSIFAIEPGWHNFYQLNRNIVLNQCQDSITALNIAISDKKSLNTFNYQDLTFGSSLHTLGKPVDFVGNPFKPFIQQTVMSYSIDSLVKEFNISHITHIKIDVDGIESKVIKGARNTLKKSSCKTLMIELNDSFEHDLKCIDYIYECGFTLISKSPNPSLFYKSDTVFNYIFAK